MVEELSEATMQHISSQNGVDSEEKVKLTMCCEPSNKIRKLRNKGAIMILVWTFLAVSTYYYLDKATNILPYVERIGKYAFGFTLPLAGWLADVYIGRYKVIRWSMWIMWVGSMLATASSVVAQLVQNYIKIHNIILFVNVLVITVGLGGYQSNVIQFGLDQLQDASSTEITAFICWYVWIVYCSLGVFSSISLTCLKQYHLLGEMLICACITAAISVLFTFDTKLMKEPTTQNPFKLIYKVIHYAIKHKHPLRRSAFTYCEDVGRI